MSNFADRYAHLSPLKRALLAVETMQARVDAAERAKSEPIAIIGVGCRFPGGVSDPDSFWSLLRNGVDAISEVPRERWDIDAFYDSDPDAPGKMYTRWGGFLKDVDRFDPQFFGISPREAAGMDPQQRLLLEVCWEALERAGQAPDRLVGSPTGVFIGMISSDYAQVWAKASDPTRIDGYFGTGTALSILAGRVSYVLGFQGPCLSVDTACSSSLVTVHLACLSLRARECDLALAGGVNLILTPEGTIYFSRVRAMAADGRCKAFDSRADGFVRSDGCGIVVLKRLSEALAARDPILAVIRGSAVNQDGRSGGLTAPNGPSQQAVIRTALANAKVEPAAIQYVETHGTGTALGDPIEVQALGAALCAGRPSDRPVALGSVKTNLGHTEAAAGIAGLLKLVLALQHREIPPHLHLQQLSPHVSWSEWPVVVPTTLTPWTVQTGTRIGAVSSFGFSGTNAHVIVEEAPPILEKPAESHKPSTFLLPLSARNPESLRTLASGYSQAITTFGSLHDTCYTASVRRSHHEYRLSIVGETADEFAGYLEAFARGEANASLSEGIALPGQQRPVIFVFPGQGGQWRGMARDLLDTEPVFRTALEECGRAMASEVSWSLLDLLRAGEYDWQDIDIVQPTLFALQVSLAALWRSWGVVPRAVVGHSMGEVAAACVAGALRLEDAVRIICRRSALLKRVRGKGAMAVLELAMPEAESVIANYSAYLSIAVSNGPRSTVISGDPEALEKVLNTLEKRGVFCRRVNVDVASHSPQMDPLRDDLLSELNGVQPQTASLPFYSTVTNRICAGPELNSLYWVRNLREPVQFWSTIEKLLPEGPLFVELSAHPTLIPAIQDGIRHAGTDAAALSSLRRDEPAHRVLLGSLGSLYCQGYPVDWSRRYPAGGTVVDLPTYPWQRERYWLDFTPPKHRASGHPLLGTHLELATPQGAHCWQAEVGIETLPFLADHRVLDRIVLPAAGYLEMATAAATEAFGPGLHAVEQVAFKEAMFFSDHGLLSVQTIMTLEMSGVASFQIATRSEGAWVTHATGRLRIGNSSQPSSPGVLDQLRWQCQERIEITELYQRLEARGLHYAASFRGISELWRRDGEAIARLKLPDSEKRHAFRLHPVVLDSAFQLLAAAMAQSNKRSTYVPVSLSQFRMTAIPSGDLWAYARLNGLEADIWLLTGAGDVFAEAKGLRVQQLDRDQQRTRRLNDWLYDIEWQHLPGVPRAHGNGTGTVSWRSHSWLLFRDDRGVAEAIAQHLAAAGQECISVRRGSQFSLRKPGQYEVNPSRPDDFRRVINEVRFDNVIYPWALDTIPTDTNSSVVSLLHLVQALAQAGLRDAPRLWLITSGAQCVEAGADVSPAQAPLWGMGRAIAHEHSELRCTCVDLSATPPDTEVDALVREFRAEGAEDQIALRGELRYGARLRRRRLPDTVASTSTEPAGDRPFALQIDKPGILDRLVLHPTSRQKPEPGEVEIHVSAAALNFLDVLSAMGLRPDTGLDQPIQLGGECAGTIVGVGDGVEHFCVGDAVVALTPGAFRSFVTVSAMFVVPKPARLSFEEAASMPIAFMTASYALERLARLTAGERVLIHSATGGVGLAAVQLSRAAGAEIFATAGTEEKREFLRSLGILQVMDSRTTRFVEQVLEATDGRGVDVVLNSLTGDAIARSFDVLAPFGRFLEIGKRDIYENKQIGLAPFRKNLSYFAVDLARMIEERPEGIRSLLVDVMDRANRGTLEPVRTRTYPIAEAVEAFRDMAQAKHIGKIAITMRHPEALITKDGSIAKPIRLDGTYLITGGLGGLGLTVAQWLVTKGARHLVLCGRRGAGSAASQMIAAMQETGAEVRIMSVDIGQRDQVERMLAEVGSGMPKVRGIVHAAGVLDDGLLLQLDAQRVRNVIAPKVQGAWNLHSLSTNMSLDFFVLFSSVAGWLGSPGQANYAAANAFLDALAQHRRAQGLPALSINWGPWSEVGLAAAETNRGTRLAFRGIGSFSPGQGVEALEEILGYEGPQVGIMDLNLRQWRQFYPKIADIPLFADLVANDDRDSAESVSAGSFRETLMTAEPARRASMLEMHVKEELAQVLRLSPSRIDARVPLRSLGIDSLMALELRNRLEAALGITLSATLVWNYPTIVALVPYLAERLGFSLDMSVDIGTHAGQASAPPVVDDTSLDQLSENEMADLLARELDALAHRKST